MTGMTHGAEGGKRFDGVGVIRATRDGGELSQRQIDALMRAYLGGEFAEEQMAAMRAGLTPFGCLDDVAGSRSGKANDVQRPGMT